MNGNPFQAPPTPALGQVSSLSRRALLVRVLLLIVLAAAALVVRSSGVIAPHEADENLPPLPGAALVVPGMVRASTPNENDLVQLRDNLGVRAVVVLGTPSVEELAAAKGLGLTVTTLEVPTGAAPTAEQIVSVLATVRTATQDGRGVVYLHDAEDTGTAPVMAAFVQLVKGVALPDVLARLAPDEQRDLSAPQAQALQDAAAELTGPGTATGAYATLRSARR